MRIEYRDYQTGWFGVELYLKQNDIDSLIRLLRQLKDVEPTQHFVLARNDFAGADKGVFGVEIIRDEEVATDTFQVLGLAKSNES